MALPPATLPLPDTREMDWMSLVDTARKAISVTSDNSTTIEDLEDDEEVEIAAGGAKAKEIHSQG